MAYSSPSSFPSPIRTLRGQESPLGPTNLQAFRVRFLAALVCCLLFLLQRPLSAQDALTVEPGGEVVVHEDLTVAGELQVGAGAAITECSDDETLAGASATAVPTERAVKVYADTKAAGTHGSAHISTGADPIPDAVAAGASGLMSGDDKTKLDGIEADATADQTNAEIEAAYNAQVPAASQAEMEAGTQTAIRRMSPLGVAQAIAALATGGSSVDIQEFTSSGTWTKPSNGQLTAIIMVWGAGGGGGRDNSDLGCGGGGGAYAERMVKLSEFGATETVMVGAGGAGRSTDGTGGSGGSSHFAGFSAYGGGGGGRGSSSGGGGGGGSRLSVGLDGSANSAYGGDAGTAGGRGANYTPTAVGQSNTEGGGGGSVSSGTTILAAGNGVNGGGGGGAGKKAANGPGGGVSIYGGGGGGGSASSGAAGPGGTSVHGGAGGAGGVAAGNASNGAAPGGGGGGAKDGNTGSGANGKVVVISW